MRRILCSIILFLLPQQPQDITAPPRKITTTATGMPAKRTFEYPAGSRDQFVWLTHELRHDPLPGPASARNRYMPIKHQW